MGVFSVHQFSLVSLKKIIHCLNIMINFNSPVEFFLPEIIFTTISLCIVVSIRTRMKSGHTFDNKRNVKFNDKTEVIFYEEPKLYIKLKDTIIDTHSSIPKRDPGNIEKMDPLGGSKLAFYKLNNEYIIRLIYENNEEVWWAREHFGNEILPMLRKYPKKDGIFISVKPDELSGEFIRYGSNQFPNWCKITEHLLKKTNENI